MSLEIVILAAGAGSRMRSSRPKVLHRIGAKTLLEHVIDVAQELSPNHIHVVYGHGGDQVRDELFHLAVNWVEQSERLGTGHALKQALTDLNDPEQVLVLYGDVPLLQVETLEGLIRKNRERVTLLTTHLSDPSGYGRIIRTAEGHVSAIVEHRDADTQQLMIDEVNSGIMVLPAGRLAKWINALGNANDQKEYYLTDIVSLAVQDGVAVEAQVVADSLEVMGVNDRNQLSILERHYQHREAQRIMRSGVTLRDPNRFDLRGSCSIGSDTEIDVDVLLEGRVVTGKNCRIGPFCRLKDVTLGDDVSIEAHTVVEDAVIGHRVNIGPFARIRPDTVLADDVRVGNFVEIKKSSIASGSKINHLSYIGDTDMGRMVNVGAGTITCNYDGASKHRTRIGDDVFIGSDTQLVAPVCIGNSVTIGAGSTITRDVEDGVLTLSRSPQKVRADWQRPRKKKT